MSGAETAAGRPDPFPRTAIDRLSPYRAWSGDRLTPATVETPGVRAALDYVEEYLASDSASAPERSWKSLMIIGQLGLGKTHLAQVIAQRLASEEDSRVRLMVLDAPTGDFTAVYRRSLIGQLDRFDLHDRLKDYYASVVAGDLDKSPATRELAAGLREGRFDPQKVVEHFGLVESALRDQLNQRMLRVAELSNFSKAFTLALIPQYEQQVWEWLQGRPPSTALREHGITPLLEDASSAYDALAVLAFVYGRVGYRFVLIIDEFDKMLPNDPAARQITLGLVERLINGFIDSHGLLVCCALPEAHQELLPSTRERVRTIRLNPFTTDELAQYISNALGEAARLFPLDAVSAITDLTGGVPRQALTMCGHAWTYAESSGAPVTTDTVRTAVREQYELSTITDVRGSMRQVLEAAGWPYVRDHLLDGFAVDFWIPLGDSGVALLITGSLLQSDDLAELRPRLRAAGAAEVILIVNGFMSASLRESVSADIGRQPLVYDDRPFNTALRELIIGATHRLEVIAREDNLTVVRRRVEQLARQQSFMQQSLEQVSGQLEGVDRDLGQQLGLLKRGIGEVRPERAPRGGLPEEVQEPFDRAFTAVDTLAGLDDLFTNAFSAEAGGAPHRRVASRELFEAAGVAVVFRRLLEGFHEALVAWLRSVATGRPLERGEQERLRLICRTYTTTAEILPLFQLESLANYAPFAPESSSPEELSRSQRRSEAREALSNLGARVLEAALSAATRLQT